MANQTLTSARNEQVIAAALSLIPVRPVEPEYLLIQCFCARHDRPYFFRYEVLPDGTHRYKDSVKMNDQSGSSGSAGKSQFKDESISFRKLGGVPPCAWCGSKGIILCGKCEWLVCKGRSVEKTFHCRKSCGRIGEPVAVKEVSARVLNLPALTSCPSPQRSLPSSVTGSRIQRSIAAPAPKLLCSSNRSK